MFFSVPLLLHLGHVLEGLQILLLGGGRGGVFQIQGGERGFQLLNAQVRHLFQPHLSRNHVGPQLTELGLFSLDFLVPQSRGLHLSGGAGKFIDF